MGSRSNAMLHGRGKSFVNGLLWRVGLQLNGLRYHNAWEALFYQYYHPNFFFVQIGANDGLRYDPLHDLIVRHDLAGIAVEPLPDIFRQLQQTYRNSPRVQLANVAIHRSDKEIVLHRVRSDADVPEWAHGMASIDPTHHAHSGIRSEDIVREVVPAVSLDELLRTHHVENIDLLQVDVEGYDFEIVRMLLSTAYRPSLIIFEHELPLGASDPGEFRDLFGELMSNGYYVIMQPRDALAYRL